MTDRIFKAFPRVLGLLGCSALCATLTACGGSAPGKEDLKQLEAQLLSQPNGFQGLFGGRARMVDTSAIHIVKQTCKQVPDFENAYDCKVSFTLADEPQENTLRAIRHKDGKWALTQNQPLDLGN